MAPPRGRLRALILLLLLLIGCALVPSVLVVAALNGWHRGADTTWQIPVVGPLVGSFLGALGVVFFLVVALGVLALVVVLAAVGFIAARRLTRRGQEHGPE